MANPTGWPSFLSLRPARSRSSHVLGRALADLLEQIDAVAARKRRVEQRDAEPLPFDLRVLPEERIPLAVLARQLAGDVGHVDQPGLEEPRIVHLEGHDVVAGAGHELGGELGRHLHALHVIDADVDAGGFSEPLAELVELGVRGGRVVHGGQDAELSRRPRGRRAPQHPGERRPTDSEKSAPADPSPDHLAPPRCAHRSRRSGPGQAGVGRLRLSVPRKAWARRRCARTPGWLSSDRCIPSTGRSTASRAWPGAAWRWGGR